MLGLQENKKVLNIYQQTRDIGISKAWECLQGNHTLSISLNLLFLLVYEGQL